MWGWALLAALVAIAALGVGLGAYPFLAIDHPAHGPDGRGARTLVVEGWMLDDELHQAAALVHTGHFERVITTGGPMPPSYDGHGWHDYATRAAALIRADGVGDVPVIAAPIPRVVRDRTYEMALAVREWSEHSGTALQAIDVATPGAHARRSATTYRLALGPGVEVGTRVMRPSLYDPTHLWTSSEGAKTTLGELTSLAWIECCFWP